MIVRVFAAGIALSLAACSPAGSVAQDSPTDTASAKPAALPVSPAGLTLIEVSVTSSDQVFTFKTELAASQEEQGRGMMFRTEMGDNEAMLFPSYEAQPRSFWMKNTPLALDIIFIGPDKRITNIEAGVPYNTNSVFSDGPTLAVLEIRGGLAAELGIKPGDEVGFELPAGAQL